MNKGEPLIDAIVREVVEETGFWLDKEKIRYVGKVFVKLPNFDFEFNMIQYQEQIEHPGDEKTKKLDESKLDLYFFRASYVFSSS